MFLFPYSLFFSYNIFYHFYIIKYKPIFFILIYLKLFIFQLFKPEGCSLGFSVVGLRSEERGELGIFVQEIQVNGIAAR